MNVPFPVPSLQQTPPGSRGRNNEIFLDCPHFPLVLVYSISRWMEEGGVVLVDEPDLFLHPGIMTDAFSAMEKLVGERLGQLIVTSHFPEMWERYENRAKRIKL